MTIASCALRADRLATDRLEPAHSRGLRRVAEQRVTADVVQPLVESVHPPIPPHRRT
jgi:hypothetical protein